jgi:hypothetical protein
MLCGDDELPSPADVKSYADAGVQVFFAAYGSAAASA